MLTAGITLMVVSVVVGVITLISAALMSSPGRAAGRRARTTVSRSVRRGGAPSHQELFGSTKGDRRSGQGEDDAPGWVLGLMVISGAGLVLGLLLVMLPSIT